MTTNAVSADTLARWEVSLNAWEWPEDLPGQPDPRFCDEKDAMRGAWAVVHALADQELVDRKWRERTAQKRKEFREARKAAAAAALAR